MGAVRFVFKLSAKRRGGRGGSPERATFVGLEPVFKAIAFQ